MAEGRAERADIPLSFTSVGAVSQLGRVLESGARPEHGGSLPPRLSPRVPGRLGDSRQAPGGVSAPDRRSSASGRQQGVHYEPQEIRTSPYGSSLFRDSSSSRPAVDDASSSATCREVAARSDFRSCGRRLRARTATLLGSMESMVLVAVTTGTR